MKEKILKLLASGVSAIGRAILPDGLYKGLKVSDNYTVLHKPGDSWQQLAEGQQPANNQVIVLTQCDTIRTTGTGRTKQTIKGSATIAVNSEFVQWPVNTYFVFRIRKGRSEVVMQPMDEKEMDELVSALSAEEVE